MTWQVLNLAGHPAGDKLNNLNFLLNLLDNRFQLIGDI